MADLSDVETALAAAVVAALYPSGAGPPSITGQHVRVYRGWPLTSALDVDLAAGIANVSIFSMPSAARNTTRWGPVMASVAGVPTLAVSVSGNAATFSGEGGVGQLAGLLVGGEAFVHRGAAGDTPVLVAAVLAEQVRAVRPCWLSGATVSVPGLSRLVARVAADGVSRTEWSRQEQGFRVSAWCPSPGSRDLICAALGSAFAAQAFIALSDDTGGRVRYRSTASFDDAQDAQMYRRDLVYDVEYSTNVQDAAPSMLFGDLQLAGGTIYG